MHGSEAIILAGRRGRMAKKWITSSKYPNVIIVKKWNNLPEDDEPEIEIEEEVQKLLPPWRSFILRIYDRLVKLFTWEI